MSKKRKPGKVSHNLVALGSAAVLTVYAAGFMRTRAAAERFADDTRRRPPAPGSEHEPPAMPTNAASAPAPTLAPAMTPAPTGASRSEARKGASPASPAASRVTTPPAGSPPPARVEASAPTPAPAAPVSATPPLVAPVAATVATLPATPAATPIPEPPATSTPASTPPPPAAAKWKDGSYTGWGTSRHGDIEATVVIAGGRILSATISQCLTRYSCSWIAALPPQVIARQSPETDYVSGATQSTNAFYYAVVEALSKAK